ncbi:cob(I)yrinic acid a,c-diamide adenosyltransferase [Coprothermobacter platensis]|jgi:cob(I)alamin adenosyltransferase|uniref:cob(I)yrinic acid a,c-diamide adenosyltransferase n=1 Tax=Coprothermobacter platensis TaxID=108819 RepID=UPI00035D3E0F|nr:cob(I)yrinic acid a,c-diamide adenosyltransferase [Coprothermobacter platensis]
MGLSNGLVHVYTGNGKGKTSAALGLALRAAGSGLKVLIVHFMKGPSFDYGEDHVLASLPNVTQVRFGTDHFVDPENLKGEDIEAARTALDFLRFQMNSTFYDVVIADELNVAVNFGLLSEEAVLNVIREKPEKVELVITGRYATESVQELADYVTFFEEKKHPFQKGIKARQGIDY